MGSRHLSLSVALQAPLDPGTDSEQPKSNELRDISDIDPSGFQPPVTQSTQGGQDLAGQFDIQDLSSQAEDGVNEIVESMAGQQFTDHVDKIRSLEWIEDWSMRFPSPLGWIGTRILDAHDVMGLEWWAAFAAVSVAFRAAYLPLAISQQAMGSRSRTIQVASRQSTKMLQDMAAGKSDVDPQVRLEQFRQMAELRKKAGVSPARMLLPMFILLPGSIFLFQGVRHMAEAAKLVPGMGTGGLPWAPDLALPDPYLVLPILSLVGAGISAAISRQTNAEMARYSPPAVNPDTIFTGLLGMQMAFFPIMATFPVGLQILFCSTSWTLMLTPLLSRQPFIHSMFGFAAGWPTAVKQIPPKGMTQQEADLKALEMAEETAAQFLPYMGGLQGLAQRYSQRKGQAQGADNPNYVGLFGLHDAGPPPPPLHVVAVNAGNQRAVEEAVGASQGTHGTPSSDSDSASGNIGVASEGGSPSQSSAPADQPTHVGAGAIRRKKRKGKRRQIH